MGTVISKMKYDDIWCTDDICVVLSEHNPKISDELFSVSYYIQQKNLKKLRQLMNPCLFLIISI